MKTYVNWMYDDERMCQVWVQTSVLPIAKQVAA